MSGRVLLPGERWCVLITGTNSGLDKVPIARIEITEERVDTGSQRIAELVLPADIPTMQELVLRTLATAWGFEIHHMTRRS